MPRVLGVIAEYNPFHLGHAHHLKAAQEAYQADYVVVVMSSCFTQRGEAALLAPRVRAEMALHCGADAVFALPAPWAARDAEHFALGGVHVLKALGCDAISFGSESADPAPLAAAARILESPDEAVRYTTQQFLQQGLPYPAAVAAAAEQHCPGAGALLSQPNSTLAVCYLRAMQRLGAGLEIAPIPRSAGYHDTALTDALPSATALRGAILRGDWMKAKAAMPPSAFRLLATAAGEGRLHRPEALDSALLARLRTMSEADFAVLPDLSEGIEHRLHSAVRDAASREDLLQRAKTRRYPYARLSRLATHALLGYTDDFFKQLPLPTPWLLGFRRESARLIPLLAGHTAIISRSQDLDVTDPLIAAELRAYDLWTLGVGLPTGLARTQGVAIV